jgi:uncharacterized protein YukE
MSDPLADPRAGDLLSAIPDQVGVLAANFRTAAAESQSTATGLAAAQHDATWTGRAADAFRRAIGRLPSELGKVQTGFQEVASALSAYEPELAHIRAAFVRTVAQLADAELAAVRSERWLPERRLGGEIADLRQKAFALLDEFASARSACSAAIAAAGATALPRPLSGQGTTVIDWIPVRSGAGGSL